MAELVGGAYLSSFFQVALEKLYSSDFVDYFHRGKLDETLLEKLVVTLNSINHVLEEAETKPNLLLARYLASFHLPIILLNQGSMNC
jgi:hypothetical protein